MKWHQPKILNDMVRSHISGLYWNYKAMKVLPHRHQVILQLQDFKFWLINIKNQIEQVFLFLFFHHFLLQWFWFFEDFIGFQAKLISFSLIFLAHFLHFLIFIWVLYLHRFHLFQLWPHMLLILQFWFFLINL